MRDAGFVVTWNVCKCKKTKGRNLTIFAGWQICAEVREKAGVASDCDSKSALLPVGGAPAVDHFGIARIRLQCLIVVPKGAIVIALVRIRSAPAAECVSQVSTRLPGRLNDGRATSDFPVGIVTLPPAPSFLLRLAGQDGRHC
jgi:hypothetical protein